MNLFQLTLTHPFNFSLQLSPPPKIPIWWWSIMSWPEYRQDTTIVICQYCKWDCGKYQFGHKNKFLNPSEFLFFVVRTRFSSLIIEIVYLYICQVYLSIYLYIFIYLFIFSYWFFTICNWFFLFCFLLHFIHKNCAEFSEFQNSFSFFLSIISNWIFYQLNV